MHHQGGLLLFLLVHDIRLPSLGLLGSPRGLELALSLLPQLAQLLLQLPDPDPKTLILGAALIRLGWTLGRLAFPQGQELLVGLVEFLRAREIDPLLLCQLGAQQLELLPALRQLLLKSLVLGRAVPLLLGPASAETQFELLQLCFKVVKLVGPLRRGAPFPG